MGLAHPADREGGRIREGKRGTEAVKATKGALFVLGGSDIVAALQTAFVDLKNGAFAVVTVAGETEFINVIGLEFINSNGGRLFKAQCGQAHA